MGAVSLEDSLRAREAAAAQNGSLMDLSTLPSPPPPQIAAKPAAAAAVEPKAEPKPSLLKRDERKQAQAQSRKRAATPTLQVGAGARRAPGGSEAAHAQGDIRDPKKAMTIADFFARSTPTQVNNYDELPRKKLQNLCKERGIKANSKTVILIEALAAWDAKQSPHGGGDSGDKAQVQLQG